MVMENHLVVLLLSVVILMGAFYGYTVEQKIFQIKNDLLKHEKEIKEVEEVKDDLESTKQELKQLKVELKAMHMELTEVKVDLESRRKEHKEVNEELESTKKEVTKVKVELESTKNEVKQVELELGSTRKELKQVNVELESKKNEVKQVKVELDTTKKEVKQVKALLDKIKTGASYVRWGRNSCAGDATLVYNGFMAGKHFASGGDGANILCLPKDPEWNRYASGLNGLTSRLFGLEMDILDNNQAFGSSSNGKNMPCAVCKTSGRSAVLMVPGRMTCHSGWHREFSGYLVAQASQTGRTATEYICADENLESVPGGDRDDNEAVLYPVEVGGCATLKCPPYVEGRELTCAVCSQ